MATAALDVLPDIKVTQLDYALGAEVRGVDISSPLSSAEIAAIRTALLERKVIIFRDCPMTPDEQIRFTKYFGNLPELPFNKRWMHPEFTDEVYLVTNKPRADGTIPETVYTGRVWHFEQSFMPQPAMGRVLHWVEAPAIGGNEQSGGVDGWLCAGRRCTCHPIRLGVGSGRMGGAGHFFPRRRWIERHRDRLFRAHGRRRRLWGSGDCVNERKRSALRCSRS